MTATVTAAASTTSSTTTTAAPALQEVALEVVLGDRVRTARAVLPADPAPGAPVLVALHGSLMDATSFRQFSGGTFDAAARRGAVVLYPDAVDGRWNDLRRDNDGTARTEGLDDEELVARLVGLAAERWGADAARAYVVGFSNGGQLAYRLAFERPDLVRGLAVVGATLPVADDVLADSRDHLYAALTDGAVPVLLVHGTADPVVPYAGGVASLFGKARGEGLSVDETAGFWVRRNGLTVSGTETDLGGDGTTTVHLTAWEQDGRPPVRLYTVVGGGHSVPNLRVRAFRAMGATNRSLDLGAVVWDFFEPAATLAP